MNLTYLQLIVVDRRSFKFCFFNLFLEIFHSLIFFKNFHERLYGFSSHQHPLFPTQISSFLLLQFSLQGDSLAVVKHHLFYRKNIFSVLFIMGERDCSMTGENFLLQNSTT